MKVIVPVNVTTLKSFNIGTPIIVSFPFVENGRLMISVGLPVFDLIRN